MQTTDFSVYGYYFEARRLQHGLKKGDVLTMSFNKPHARDGRQIRFASRHKETCGYVPNEMLHVMSKHVMSGRNKVIVLDVDNYNYDLYVELL